MGNITIGRYGNDCTVTSADGSTRPLAEDVAGWIEADDWIIFLDGNGRPATIWLERDEAGGVIGDPIQL